MTTRHAARPTHRSSSKHEKAVLQTNQRPGKIVSDGWRRAQRAEVTLSKAEFRVLTGTSSVCAI
ncbi:hypothetical protein COCC4DRAFT_65802 [Bipolaris maydis ATCC 48331]|uniref:Uncharacterized protein n=2 Tax=Cochliobolus heterostrophus TaxID=5016 RepID=M2U8Z3_COCH5|nr:uncharacterized protein COCC4DRAFT_65802 [Bipolaris maydis ATCC 48331]EMD95059.1 hypothetical protein COCHEDRAFT_1152897 [Bipolaris maydis C5]ENI00075.1 hypothetical protein COCC4DRAFT_65802 [Bipolaris maydis ATCC 48331]